MSRNPLDSQVFHGLSQALKVLVTESRVESTHHTQIPFQHTLLNATLVESMRSEFAILAQRVKCSDGGEQFVGRRGIIVFCSLNAENKESSVRS